MALVAICCGVLGLICAVLVWFVFACGVVCVVVCDCIGTYRFVCLVGYLFCNFLVCLALRFGAVFVVVFALVWVCMFAVSDLPIWVVAFSLVFGL